jgi:hypothetical protein
MAGAEWKTAHEQRLIRGLRQDSHWHFHTCVEKIEDGTILGEGASCELDYGTQHIQCRMENPA